MIKKKNQKVIIKKKGGKDKESRSKELKKKNMRILTKPQEQTNSKYSLEFTVEFSV